ncbi:diguanylate cyclase [Thalassotalea aquiviva]|uniref:sensor domain-containing diguanylate cyclase n=1 Tax=Thalassotalea aquiviva TaxID=3242415 RepID=UPI00352B9D8A
MTIINSLLRNLDKIHAPYYGALIHRNFKVLKVDEGYAKKLGFKDANEVLHLSSYLSLLPAQQHQICKERQQKILQKDIPFGVSLVSHLGPTKQVHDVLSIEMFIEFEGQGAIEVAVIDVTDLVQAQKQLVDIEERYQQLVESSMQAILVHDNFKPIFCNQAYATMVGCDSADTVMSLPSILPFIPKEEQARAKLEYNKLISGEVDSLQYEKPNITVQGEKIWVNLISKRIDWRGKFAVLVSLVDITDKYLLQQKITHQATFDGLTQVLNRASLVEKIEQEIALAIKHNQPLSCVMVDLDNFKAINDTYGHEMGDEVLKKFSFHCQSWLRRSDLMGRWGGDEFLLVLPGETGDVAFQLANRLITKIANLSVEVHGVKLHFSTSMGVAELDVEHHDLSAIVAKADIALYRAKRAGKNRVAFNNNPII